MNIFLSPFKKYATFGGRATRSEFWCFTAFFVVVTTVANLADVSDGDRHLVAGRFGAFELIASLVLLLPMLSVGTRRLHDTGRSGWWMLLLYGPYLLWSVAKDQPTAETLSLGGVLVGFVALVILFVLKSDAADNQFGAPSQ